MDCAYDKQFDCYELICDKVYCSLFMNEPHDPQCGGLPRGLMW